MATFVENSLLDVSERNSMAITLNIHAKSHTVRGRPTLKLVERFENRQGGLEALPIMQCAKVRANFHR